MKSRTFKNLTEYILEHTPFSSGKKFQIFFKKITKKCSQKKCCFVIKFSYCLFFGIDLLYNNKRGRKPKKLITKVIKNNNEKRGKKQDE